MQLKKNGAAPGPESGAGLLFLEENRELKISNNISGADRGRPTCGPGARKRGQAGPD